MKKLFQRITKRVAATLLLALAAVTLYAQDAAGAAAEAAKVNAGNTAWIIVATILVLLMTIPGLALFYGGLVRQKNLLSIIMQPAGLLYRRL